MKKLVLQDLSLKGKKILMRVDFNVPMKEDTILDDERIREVLPSIRYVLEKGGSLILMSHFGRPKGKKDPKLSLKPCAKRLSELLQKDVSMASDCIGPEVQKKAKDLKPGEILLLENLRFYDAEENPEKDLSFAQKLSELGDVYVDDAFGAAHRSHSSITSITKFFPKTSAAGFLLQKEMSFLGKFLQNPQKPFYAIVGGAKVSTKIGVLLSLIPKIDALFIGGGMSYTFLKVLGKNVGKSPVEESFFEKAKKILEECEKKKVPCYLPSDYVIAEKFQNDTPTQIVSVEKTGIPDGWEGMDIGPQTIERWSKALQPAKSVFWNGPVGVFEFPNFIKGTREIAKTLSNLSHAVTIVGGGDSLAAIHELHLEEKVSHLSTGGGACLEYIEFGHLPGIDALTDKS